MRTASAKFAAVSGWRNLPSMDTAPVRSATTSAIAEEGSSVRAGSIRLGDSIVVIGHHLAEVGILARSIFIDNTLTWRPFLADIVADLLTDPV